MNKKHDSKTTSRLEKYAERGFAVAVPGLLQERISKALVEAPYVYIDRYDLLLKVGACEKSKDVEVTYQSDPFRSKADTIKVSARACQKGTSVRDLARLIVLDKGLARMVNTPKRWLCEKHDRIVCENANLTGACVPLGLGIPGHFILLWGCQPADIQGDVEDAAPEEEGYQITSLAQVYGILEKAHRQDALADELPEMGWWRGGVMQRLSSTMARSDSQEAYRLAVEAHTARAASGNPLLFVWDPCGEVAAFRTLALVLSFRTSSSLRVLSPMRGHGHLRRRV